MLAAKRLVNNQIQNIISFFNISNNYLKKRNPFMNMVSNTIQTVYTFITSKKRLKALRYQVRLMYYRMQQMEKLIEENNPQTTLGRGSFDRYR